MNPKKSQNSLLILTTLGVYLGLLMVGGAAPQVFAHSATTRNFEIADEIEVKDDLDNKPGLSDTDLDDLVTSYLNHVETLVRNLRDLRSIDKLNLTSDSFDVSEVSYLPCPETGGLISKDKDSHIDRWILPAIIEAKFVTERLASAGDCVSFNETANRTEARSSGVRIVPNKVEFSFESSIFLRSNQTEPFYSGLVSALKRYAVEQDAEAELNKVLLKNTSARKTDTQVLLVTHLPRADLDALLAKDAK